MSNEFVARKGLIISDIQSGVTETQILVVDANGLIKYRTDFSLSGDTGSSGTSGTSGSSGTSGTNGTSGSSGTHGTNGTNGTSGSSGTNGTNGTSGSSGTNGTNGTSGSSGTHGTNGTNGTSGSSGTNGTNGTSGSSGTNGTNGTSGSSGTNGTSGSSGTHGTNGTNGTSGSSGTNGTNGTSGSSGTNGTNGTSGSSGTNGTSGSSGTHGTNGTNGTSGSSGTNGTNGTSGSSGTNGTSGSSGIALVDGVEKTSFYGNLGSGFNALVYISAVQSDKILLGGNFTTLSGVTRNHIVRLNLDGTDDVNFYSNLINSGDTSGFNGNITTIAVQSDGKILVGGDFTALNGITRNRLVRLNSNGVEDTSFSTNLGTGFDIVVNMVKIQKDDKIIVGGNFNNFNSISRLRLLRLNSDGTEDSTFYNNFGGNFNNVMYAITILSNGSIVLGGTFTSACGQTRNRIVKLNSDGTEDASFYANIGVNGFNSAIYWLESQKDDKILVGGGFTTLNLKIVRNRLLRLNSDGTEDSAFYNNFGGFNNGVYTISVQNNDQITVGGVFTQISGVTTRNKLVRLNSNGIEDATFYGKLGTGFNNNVYTILTHDTDIIVGGSFTGLNGNTRNYITSLWNFSDLSSGTNGTNGTSGSSGNNGVVDYTVMDDSGGYTGFINGSDIIITYNYTGRTITLTPGTTLDYYWRGKKYSLGTTWTSTGHTATVGSWFLYSTDGVNFSWSQTPWEFDQLMVAFLNYSTEPNTFAIRETHGLMDWFSHEEFHNQVGTYLYSGGKLTSGTYVENSATETNRFPSFDAAVVNDEDLSTTISTWSKSGYTTMYVSGTTSIFNTGSTRTFIANSNAYIQVNNPTLGTLTVGVNARWYNVYQILIPTTSDTTSQKYRVVMLQPQVTYTSLVSAIAEDTRGLNLGGLSSLSAEFVIYARITYVTASVDNNFGKCRIAGGGVTYVLGNKMSTISIAGISSTNHAALSNLTWIDSGHIGTPNTLAAFDVSGNATGITLTNGTSGSSGTNGTSGSSGMMGITIDDGIENIDFYNTIGSGFDNNVRTTVIQKNGQVLVGGDFITLNSNSRKYLVRLNSDGTEDMTFNNNYGSLNGAVYVVKIQENGQILVGGNFTSLNLNTRLGLVKLNSDGTEDPSFYANFNGFNDVVYTISIQPDDKIIVGGNFTDMGGNTRNYLVRLNSDGTEDTTFYTNYGGILSSYVSTSDIAYDVNGFSKIYVGGDFTSPNGYILSLFTDGTIDTSFGTYGTGFDNTVNDIKVKQLSTNDHIILVGGKYNNYDGSSQFYLCKLNPSGIIESSFSTILNINGGLSAQVFSICLQPNDQILIGGDFGVIGVNVVSKFMRLNLDGTEDIGFSVNANLIIGFDNTVLTISSYGSKIYIGGKYGSYNSNTRNYLLSLWDFSNLSSGTNGTSGSSGTNGTSGSSGTMPETIELIEEINFNVYVLGETDIYLDDYAWYDYQVSGLTLRTPTGTCTLDMMISSTGITGMSNITGTTSMNIYYSTANSKVVAGNSFYIKMNTNDIAQYLIGSVKIFRT